MGKIQKRTWFYVANTLQMKSISRGVEEKCIIFYRAGYDSAILWLIKLICVGKGVPGDRCNIWHPPETDL